MEYRNLEITLVAADGLKDINFVGRMDLYAVAYLASHPSTKQKTSVDKNCGTTPRWNQKLKFTLDERSLASPPGGGLYLIVRIMAEKFGSDKDIGKVALNILELFKDGVEVEKRADYQIQGRGKGVLNISYKFGEKFSQGAYDVNSRNVDQPALAYPPSNSGKYGQAGPGMPPPQGYEMGGGPPPQHGYSPYQSHPPTGYPPAGYPQAGYPPAGYPQAGYPPAGYSQAGYPGYGAPPGNPGYGAPPPQGYGGYYPPPQGGYGPPPQQPYGYGGYNQQAMPKKKKSGKMGMGLGLGAGLLGGMLLGDMMGDVGEAAAYADGYGDAMDDGFDF